MKTLCTFTRVAELRRALPAHDPVTLVFTPEHMNDMPFSFLAFEGGQGVMVDAISNTMMQPKAWVLSRAELDRALAAFLESRVITVTDDHRALILTAGTQSAMVSSIAPPPRAAAAALPKIRPIAPRPAAPAPSPAAETQTQAYKIFDAALHLSGASNGVPIMERYPQGYQITISDVLVYQIDTTEQNTTVITVISGNSSKHVRYPTLTELEWNTLLQIWKKLGAALRRKREERA